MDMIQATLPQIVERRDTLAIAADVAVVLTGLAVLVVGVVIVLTLLELRSTVREVRGGLRKNFEPAARRARAISDNLEFVTDRLRHDVQHLTDAVGSLSKRLQQASDHMEDRIEEFNLLMETVQGEAEDIFLDTAATVHGIREGARTISMSDKTVHDPSEAAPEADSRASSGVGPRGSEGVAGADGHGH
ncbi:MAG: hypothetical protein WD995_13425 [Gemmatimonadota bacterium]